MEGILISDIEGVLLDGEYLPNLAEQQGKKELVQEITEKGIKGEIHWEESLRERLEILSGADYKEAIKIAEKMHFMKGAKTLCSKLKEKGYVLIGVTGGFSIFSDRVKGELGLDYMISNELEFNDGKLNGLKNLRVNVDNIEGLGDILEKEDAENKKVVALADGANNLKLFEHADLKLAFNSQPIIERHADIVIENKNLENVLEFIP